MDAELQAAFDRLHARLDGHDERFDRMMASVAGLFEAAQARTEERFDALEQRMGAFEKRMDAFEQRMGAFEHRMDAFEQRMESLDVRMTEKLIGVDERFATMRLATEQFQARVLRALETIAADMRRLEVRMSVVEEGLAHLSERVTAVEQGLVGLSDRVDGLSEDMRLRFRQVNDRLTGLAA